MPEVTFKFDTKKELDDFLSLVLKSGKMKCKECKCSHTRNSDFCSEKCYNHWYHREQYTPDQQARPLPEKVCKECGIKFYAKNIRAEYCSRRCNQAVYRRNKRFNRKNKLDVVVNSHKTYESARRHFASLPSIQPISRPGYQNEFN